MKTLDQLKLLWSHGFISILFDVKSAISEATPTNKNNFKLVIRGVFDKIIANNKQHSLLNSPEAQSVYRICSFYRQLLLVLNEPRIEILSGIWTDEECFNQFHTCKFLFLFKALSFEEEFLLGLWNFMKSLGPMCGLRDLVGLLESTRDFKSHPIFDVLYILTSLVLYLVT